MSFTTVLSLDGNEGPEVPSTTQRILLECWPPCHLLCLHALRLRGRHASFEGSIEQEMMVAGFSFAILGGVYLE